jgi:hypothetical protein
MVHPVLLALEHRRVKELPPNAPFNGIDLL